MGFDYTSKRFRISLGVIIVLLLVFVVVITSQAPVLFNQHYIEDIYAQEGVFNFFESLNAQTTFFSWKLRSFFFVPDNDIAFDDVDGLFYYLLSNVPTHAQIYPTEFYYYYLYTIPEHRISGNLRFVEADNGRIGMGYFDIDNQELSGHKLYGAEEGLEIEKTGDLTYKLIYKDLVRHFTLPGIQYDGPMHMRESEDEVFVAKVRDESGVILYLYFNEAETVFYYVLDEITMTEELEHITGSIFVGKRSGFAYYHDKEFDRKILFGVSARNVYENNYFDGPFDQVPPNLNLRPMIYQAYPYTQFGSGIDRFGNFIDVESTRVAISAYTQYYSRGELRMLVGTCEDITLSTSELWACLTYEEKEDYHLDSPLFYTNGTLKDRAVFDEPA